MRDNKFVFFSWSSGLITAGIMLILVLSGLSLRHKTLTFDEAVHFSYGVAVLRNNPGRYDLNDNSKMPVSVLNVFWSRLVDNDLYCRLLKGNDLSRLESIALIANGRGMTIMFSVFLALLVFLWAYELYGLPAAFFSFFLYCFDPNIAAHAQLVTVDLYISFMILASAYLFWRFLKFGGVWRGLVSAFVVGLAQIVKYTALPLYPLFLVMALIKHWAYLSALMQSKRWGTLLGSLAQGIMYSVLYIVVGLFIINAGFLFKESFVPLQDYSFKSHAFHSMQTSLGSWRVPVPYPYLQGMDWVKYADETGGGFGNMYCLGELHMPSDGGHLKGFPGYFFIASLLKVPLATSVIILLACWAYWRKRSSFKFKDNEQLILVPVVFFLVLYNYFINMHIGIRHILYTFPLLYVFAGSLFMSWAGYSKRLRMLFLGLMAYLVCSVLSFYPHYMAYFNELVWDRKMAYQYLADSNIYIGGNEWWLKQYWQKHPDIILFPVAPVPGRIIVTINELVGIIEPERYRWLRENFQPVDHIAYSYLVFDVSPVELRKIGY